MDQPVRHEVVGVPESRTRESTAAIRAENGFRRPQAAQDIVCRKEYAEEAPRAQAQPVLQAGRGARSGI